MDPVIVECPNCQKKLRAPGDRKLLLRCNPKQGGCSHVWEWMPGQVGETTVLVFRCGKTGGPFEVRLSRKKTTEAFRVTGIESRSHTAAASMGGEDAEQDTFARTYAGDSFDWAGWRCPHCKRDGLGGRAAFVQCSGCHELVCCHNSIQITGGGQTFKCHPACGNSGEIVGSIETFSASSVAVNPGKAPLLPSTLATLRIRQGK